MVLEQRWAWFVIYLLSTLVFVSVQYWIVYVCCFFVHVVRKVCIYSMFVMAWSKMQKTHSRSMVYILKIYINIKRKSCFYKIGCKTPWIVQCFSVIDECIIWEHVICLNTALNFIAIYHFQFNLSQFLSTWEKSVPEGMKTNLFQLEVYRTLFIQ